MPAIRILVVDDHTLFRRGLVALLARDAQMLVVGDAADASEAQRRVRELQPDLVLLDNHLPGVSGVDALPSLREAAPLAKFLMLTVSEDAADMAQALRRGASGYLLKTMEGEELADAIRRAMRGEAVIAGAMTTKLVSAYRDAAHNSGDAAPTTAATSASTLSVLSALSPRELDILRGIARGESNKEIARALAIAETTVKVHVQHIFRKLGLSSRVQVAVYASARGLG